MLKAGPVVEELVPDLYKVEVPIPNNPLRALNAYVAKSKGRSLIIDTGVYHEEAERVWSCALDKLGLALSKTDIFCTHMHADHVGLVKKLITDSSKFYFNRIEAPTVNSARHWQELNTWEEVYHFRRRHGFPEPGLEQTLKAYPGVELAFGKDVEIAILDEGDTLEVGDFRFRALETPGHSAGHMCLYEENNKLLVAGDHVLAGVTPNVAVWTEAQNYLEDYLASLDKLLPLEVKLVLPAHKHIFTDLEGRIDELRQHHEHRTGEILSILESGDQSAYQIVPQMTWQVDCASWHDLPFDHKFISFGEGMAHLKYMEGRGRIHRKEILGKVIYSLNGRK